MTETRVASTGTQIIVMGVSGSGKSTIGALIAGVLGVPFVDGDALHPRSNIEKMAGGTPLTDEDRLPWLTRVGSSLADAASAGPGVVIACSALRRSYRDAIAAGAPGVHFIHLAGSPDLLASRLEGRNNHFMPSTLLSSQLATLEPLGADECGTVLDIDRPAVEIVDEAVAAIHITPRKTGSAP